MSGHDQVASEGRQRAQGRAQPLMSLTMGEWVFWPSHEHIDMYTKDLVKQLRDNNINIGKVYNIIESFFGTMENKGHFGTYACG